jgi:hypothetical protein
VTASNLKNLELKEKTGENRFPSLFLFIVHIRNRKEADRETPMGIK